MRRHQNNYAFIDSQNLNLSIRNQGWVLDFRRFRRYLEDKCGVTVIYQFTEIWVHLDFQADAQVANWESKREC